MTERIKELFSVNNGYVTAKQMPDNATYMAIQRLVNKGVVDRVRKGVYYYSEDDNHLMIDIDKVVPSGVLCLYSAWFYYDLSVQIPQSYCVAIEKSRKLILPSYPPISLYYWKKEYQELGVARLNVHGYDVPIYDIEKCVCDAIKHRTRVGIEVSSEVVRNYLKRKDRDLVRLIKYASKMRVKNILMTYLEIEI